MVIEKKALHIITNRDETEQAVKLLEKHGLGIWKPKVVTKMLMLCHIAAYLITLLGKNGSEDLLDVGS